MNPSPLHLPQPDGTHPDRGPAAPSLAAGFLLAGLGTALLGPILPSVTHAWRLTDAAAGTLFLAKFVGAFLGGISVSQRLRLSLLSGALLCALGFGGFALAGGLASGAALLFIGGFGLGQMIASTNILAGLRYARHTGSALAALNFFWALGAVLTGLLAAVLLPRFGLRTPLLCFAGLFLLCAAGYGLGRPVAPQAPTHTSLPTSGEKKLAPSALLVFATLLFLYGGLETCLTSWLPTFTLRVADHPLLHGQSAVVLLWTALTAGRALSSAILRVVSERVALACGLAISIVLIAALALSHSAALLSAECILLGLSLAPFFPATFALLMHLRPAPRTAGFVIAVSGLGAALFPWLMGVVSTHTGSLSVAMAVPAILAAALLALALLPCRIFTTA